MGAPVELAGAPVPEDWVAEPDGRLVGVGELVPVMAVPVTEPVSEELLPLDEVGVLEAEPDEEPAVGQTAESGTLTPTPPQIPLANWMVSEYPGSTVSSVPRLSYSACSSPYSSLASATSQPAAAAAAAAACMQTR